MLALVIEWCVILLTSAVAATRFAILALGVDFNSLSLGPKATTVFLPSWSSQDLSNVRCGHWRSLNFFHNEQNVLESGKTVTSEFSEIKWIYRIRSFQNFTGETKNHWGLILCNLSTFFTLTRWFQVCFFRLDIKIPPKTMYTALKAKKGLDSSKSNPFEERMCYHTHSSPNESIDCVVRCTIYRFIRKGMCVITQSFLIWYQRIDSLSLAWDYLLLK